MGDLDPSTVPDDYHVEPDPDGGEWHVVTFCDGHRVMIFTDRPLVIVEAEKH